MAVKRSTLSERDLRKMAKVSIEYGVNVRGHFDALGNCVVSVAPPSTAGLPKDNDDLDDRLEAFAAK